VKPDFEVDQGNAESIARICSALDGVPLALELAAARIRVLSPASLLERLDRSLAVLVGGARDLPERQRTLRNTIEWSAGLLDEEQRRMLARLGVFRGGFSLEAAEAVAVDSPDVDALTVLSELVDNSLISQQDRRTWTRFIMLATVREWAQEQLSPEELALLRERLARFYLDLGDRIEFDLEGARQRELVQRLTDARDNLRAVQRYLLDAGRYAEVAHLSWALYVYWWVGGHLGEVRSWVDEILASGAELDDPTRAIAVYFTASIGFWQDPDGLVAQRLTESAELFHKTGNPGGEGLALISLGVALLARLKPEPQEASVAFEKAVRLFRESGDGWGESLALVTLGRFALAVGQPQAALERFQESLALTRERHDELGETIAIHHVAWAHLALGAAEEAAEEFRSGLEESSELGHDEGVVYGLEGMLAIAARLGDVERAGRMLGAAQTLREQSGLTNSAARILYQPFVDAILAGEQAEAFERARLAGRDLSLDAAVDFALERVEAGDGR
jgi:tetratricopeptide (TPR) repeat protein